jgi:hypothetical protein
MMSVDSRELREIKEAVRNGQFHIYAVSSIDEGMEVLTGVAAGERDSEGHYPEGSINNLVAKKLRQFSEQLRQFASATNSTEAATSKSE